jgi:ParB-like nuclease domain
VSVSWVATREMPLVELQRFPGNARRGNVSEIRKSVRRNGQYRALVVREHNDGNDYTILAGNHTAMALMAEGYVMARCEIITCTDAEARRVNLADNKLSDIAEDDPDALVELLSYLDEDYEGSGWTAEEVERMLTPSGDPEVPDVDMFGVIVQCGTADEQSELLEELKGRGWVVRALASA